MLKMNPRQEYSRTAIIIGAMLIWVEWVFRIDLTRERLDEGYRLFGSIGVIAGTIFALVTVVPGIRHTWRGKSGQGAPP